MDEKHFYKHILNSMRDMVLVKGPKSRLLWANKAFLDYYGMSEEELIGIVDGVQSDPDNTLQYVRDDKSVFDTNQDLNVPSEPVTNSSGDVNYFHTIKSPVFENGEMTQMVGVSRLIEDPNIQEQDLTEMDAKVFTAPLRSIIDSYPMATMLLDHDLRVIKCNERWSKLFGDAPGTLTKSFEEHYKDLVKLSESATKSLDSQSEIQTVIQIKFGDSSKYFDFRTTPWKYPNDSIGGLIVLATDVTSIKRNEEYLLVSQKKHEILNSRLVLALEASAVGVWEFDVTEERLIWDQQMYSLYGIKEENFDGAYSAWENGLHPEDKESAVLEIQKATSTGGKFDTEFRVIWPSGEVRTIRALADSITGVDGQTVKMIGVNWDISDVKNNENKLRSTNTKLTSVNEELTEFSYRTSHDLKAPLSTSKMLAEFILLDIDGGDLEEAKTNTIKVQRQMERLEDLVTDILSLTRADFGEFGRLPVDFHNVVESVRQKLAWMDEENTVTLRASISTTTEFIGDTVRLTQVLENLVSNSIKYKDMQKEDRFVLVDVSEEEAGVRILVEDNGIGIPKEDHSDVFKMFKRFHPNISSGSGLGLSIVKKNIERMGGTIELNSSGDGTSFSISLPNMTKTTP